MGSRSGSWLPPALLLAISLLLALGLGEAVVRLRGVDLHPAAAYSFHPLYGWVQEPSPRREHLPESGDGRAMAASSDARRVLVLGDSFTYAVEHQRANTFAGLMAAEVTARGGSLLSLSSGGWGTAQEYLALMREGLDWQPDVVVLQVFPFNDLCNNSIALAHACSWQDHLRPYFVLGENGIEQTWLQPVRARLRSASRLVGLFDRYAWSRRMGSPGDSREEFRRRTMEFTRANARAIGLEHTAQTYTLFPATSQPQPIRQAWAITEALFAAIQNELEARGIRLVAVVIPFSRTFGTDWSEYRRRRPRVMERDHGTRHTEEIFARLGVPVVSLRRRIEENELVPAQLFNRGNRHLTRTGHRWTAQWILEELEAGRSE